ncbi:hypothetical protein LTR17_008600 [Elasticomyces elasticus]|nr:hypothetical protein LTR17_008600 [Elasticomyces elasticus]
MPSIAILGRGIYGLSTAYALAQMQNSGRDITIMDIAEHACEGARPGQPIALLNNAHVKDPDLAALLQYSLAMHAEIPAGFSWLNRGMPWKSARWSKPTEYCSVDPHALGCFLLDEIRACGSKVLFSTQVMRALRYSGQAVNAVLIRPVGGDESSEFEIPCDRLLIAAGPWTAKGFETLHPSATLDVPIYADTAPI